MNINIYYYIYNIRIGYTVIKLCFVKFDVTDVTFCHFLSASIGLRGYINDVT